MDKHPAPSSDETGLRRVLSAAAQRSPAGVNLCYSGNLFAERRLLAAFLSLFLFPTGPLGVFWAYFPEKRRILGSCSLRVLLETQRKETRGGGRADSNWTLLTFSQGISKKGSPTESQ